MILARIDQQAEIYHSRLSKQDIIKKTKKQKQTKTKNKKHKMKLCFVMTEHLNIDKNTWIIQIRLIFNYLSI